MLGLVVVEEYKGEGEWGHCNKLVESEQGLFVLILPGIPLSFFVFKDKDSSSLLSCGYRKDFLTFYRGKDRVTFLLLLTLKSLQLKIIPYTGARFGDGVSWIPSDMKKGFEKLNTKMLIAALLGMISQSLWMCC